MPMSKQLFLQISSSSHRGLSSQFCLRPYVQAAHVRPCDVIHPVGVSVHSGAGGGAEGGCTAQVSPFHDKPLSQQLCLQISSPSHRELLLQFWSRP